MFILSSITCQIIWTAFIFNRLTSILRLILCAHTKTLTSTDYSAVYDQPTMSGLIPLRHRFFLGASIAAPSGFPNARRFPVTVGCILGATLARPFLGMPGLVVMAQ